MKEEHAIVLDFLQRGYSSSYSGEPVAQAMGVDYFSLFELIPKDGVFLNLKDKVFIGQGERQQVRSIKAKIEFGQLTSTARAELPHAVEDVIKSNEARFINIFNKASAINMRMHQLELLPGIGKKHLYDILEQREKKPFESFKDLMDRVHLMPDPAKVIADRIMDELQDANVKYRLFVPAPAPKRPY